MFQFILCINRKSVLRCPWKLLYWCPWLVKFVKLRCKQKGVFHVFLDNKLRFKIITGTISANPALDKTFAFTIIKKTDWYRVVTNHIDVHHGRTREGKVLVMALNIDSTVRVCEDILPGHGTRNCKNADYFAAIGLVTFCDSVWSLSLWVCVESCRNIILLVQFCAKTWPSVFLNLF